MKNVILNKKYFAKHTVVEIHVILIIYFLRVIFNFTLFL